MNTSSTADVCMGPYLFGSMGHQTSTDKIKCSVVPKKILEHN